jgi:hypothetical protein
VSAGEFIARHPPAWEVKLWNGEDGNGSSWSCEHGMGRWFRDCGCRPPANREWRQEWRGPLRRALDSLRDRVRETARRELGALLIDADEARDDYIEVVLKPTPAARQAFLRRHAARALSAGEAAKLWRLLEAFRHAMLMYASCGWFFDEISGLEPVQNMRYALRAAELIQPWNSEDLIGVLEAGLTEAKSNLPEYGDGSRVFQRLALSARYSGRELAAGLAVSLAAGFPSDWLAWSLVGAPLTARDGASTLGSFVCHNARLDLFIRTGWRVRLEGFDDSAVELIGYEEIPGEPYRENDAGASAPRPLPSDFGMEDGGERVDYDRLPLAVRNMLYRKFASGEEDELLAQAAATGGRASIFLARARQRWVEVPADILASSLAHFKFEVCQAFQTDLSGLSFTEASAAALRLPLDRARGLGLNPDTSDISRQLLLSALEMLAWLAGLAQPGWLDERSSRRLADGGEWIPPVAGHNLASAYPEAGGFQLALGKGLARLRAKLAEADGEPGQAGIRLIPLPELLSYAEKAGLSLSGLTQLTYGFWDFLEEDLPAINRCDRREIMAGELGERLRRIGKELGFSDEMLEKQLLSH